MLKATRQDKELVIDILARSFATNNSVNYIVQQDSKKDRRLLALMDYSFEICSLFGEVFVSENRKACAPPKNLPWYERFGFHIYGQLDLGYTMYFLKKGPEPSPPQIHGKSTPSPQQLHGFPHCYPSFKPLLSIDHPTLKAAYPITGYLPLTPYL